MMLTLKSNEELRACRARLKERGLDFTEPGRLRFWRALYKLRFRADLQAVDETKSWDVANASAILERGAPDRGTPILDMGCFNSEILYVLKGLGYRNLHGCDLNPMCRWMPFWNQIHYRLGDLMHTPYPDKAFGAITCLSVVEHGVEPAALAAEAGRLLRPGGLFLFSTDYDATGAPHEVPPQFRVFGQEWRIFDRDGLQQFIGQFAEAGFSLLDSRAVDGDHDGRPIQWNGQDYTFVIVALRAPG